MFSSPGRFLERPRGLRGGMVAPVGPAREGRGGVPESAPKKSKDLLEPRSSNLDPREEVATPSVVTPPWHCLRGCSQAQRAPSSSPSRPPPTTSAPRPSRSNKRRGSSGSGPCPRNSRDRRSARRSRPGARRCPGCRCPCRRRGRCSQFVGGNGHRRGSSCSAVRSPRRRPRGGAPWLQPHGGGSSAPLARRSLWRASRALHVRTRRRVREGYALRPVHHFPAAGWLLAG